MYVQAEGIEVHGNFPINITKRELKKKYVRILEKSTTMYQESGEIQLCDLN